MLRRSRHTLRSGDHSDVTITMEFFSLRGRVNVIKNPRNLNSSINFKYYSILQTEERLWNQQCVEFCALGEVGVSV